VQKGGGGTTAGLQCHRPALRATQEMDAGDLLRVPAITLTAVMGRERL
jgi:hypothetical protein